MINVPATQAENVSARPVHLSQQERRGHGFGVGGVCLWSGGTNKAHSFLSIGFRGSPQFPLVTLAFIVPAPHVTPSPLVKGPVQWVDDRLS